MGLQIGPQYMFERRSNAVRQTIEQLAAWPVSTRCCGSAVIPRAISRAQNRLLERRTSVTLRACFNNVLWACGQFLRYIPCAEPVASAQNLGRP